MNASHMAGVEEEGAAAAGDDLSLLYLKSAILALEPPDAVISLARLAGGGSLATKVQSFILDHCITSFTGEFNDPFYVQIILKKIIVCAESDYEEVIEEIYEKYAHCISSFKDIASTRANMRVIKRISFLYRSRENRSKLECFIIPVRCSLNLLEGDTGCAIWPSSLFLSEFIFSYPGIFRNKYCLELGSGVGLVGIALTKVNALKVALTDGDTSSLTNLKFNLTMNQLDVESQVYCRQLSWEAVTEAELESFQPEIVLGADIIYNPDCIPHLLRVLAILLRRKIPFNSEAHSKEHTSSSDPDGISRKSCNPSSTDCNCNTISEKASTAYIAAVIRNADTFSSFLKLACETNLYVTDVTETIKISNLFPYMHSYDRANVRLFKVSPWAS